MTLDKRHKSLIFLGIIILGGFTFSRELLDSNKSLPTSRKNLWVSYIWHPSNASRGESVWFVMYASCSSSYHGYELNIRGNRFTNIVDGQFYWYMESPYRSYDADLCDILLNFTLVFPTPGIWTIKINEYSTSIIIV